MLFYLINVMDNTWLLALGGPLALWAARFGLGIGPRDVRPVDKSFRRALLVGILAGLLVSAVYAFLRRTTGWVIREYYNLGVLVPAIASALALTALVGLPKGDGKKKLVAVRAVSALALGVILTAAVWYFSGSRQPSRHLVWLSLTLFALLSVWPLKIRRSLPPLMVTAAVFLAALTARCAPNLLLYPFEFGVGLDSVFNLDYLAKATGYCLGLAVMALFWFSLGLLLRRAPAGAARVFALLALVLITTQLALEAGQILAARRLIPRFWFSVVLWLLERENGFFWIQAGLWWILAIGVIAKARLSVPVGANPALRRKDRARLRGELRSGLALGLSMAMVFLTATTLRAVSRRGPVIAEPRPIVPVGDCLIMDLEPLSDGNLHRLVYDSPTGTPVRFIVVKKSQSAFGVGLDACDICGQSGYYQRGDQVVCKLCDVVMNKSTIGFPGGCNPVPLDFELSEGTMVIRVDNLEAEAYRFK
ncbi:MAG: Fe-S-containing protein [Deltaproteobacteria bacterium]|jgi:uncharacterized membrane protein|nr:Fe-S-containing protein [Deltaproteobacteria bacterium]